MKFLLKPVFIGWLTLLAQLPFQLLFTIWFGGLFGIMSKSDDSNLSFILFGGVAFIAFPLVIYIAKKFNYQRTEYKFYDDRLEFEEGFFTIHKKTIKFKDVREVTLRRGVFQRMYGLGTVYLATLATGSSNYANVFSAIGFGNISASGVSIRDINNSEEIYQKIKEMVDSNS